MKLRHRPAIALLCLPLLLTGCSGDDEEPEAKPPATSAAATTPSGTPTSSPPMQPMTRSGAADFVRRWVKALNEGGLTGETQELQELSHSTCDPCNRLIEYIDSIYDEGGSIESGTWRIEAVGQIPDNAPIQTPQVAVQIHQDRQVIQKSESAAPVVVKPLDQTRVFYLEWHKKTGWLMHNSWVPQ